MSINVEMYYNLILLLYKLNIYIIGIGKMIYYLGTVSNNILYIWRHRISSAILRNFGADNTTQKIV